ncbi:helix-turn-helix transcriptional regulator [Dactylosporangium sp. NPDC005572]|uniref:helix-turn-helix domain-containing protein n=1 Tax=Dactylosporangium sp. NPDC005572 TaxID=3156889 RepID=UPI0033B2D24A
MATPTIRRTLLARELRRLRLEAGLTVEEAAGRAGISKSALSRIENALVAARLPDVRALLAEYAVDHGVADQVLDLCRAANVRGWWQNYPDVLSEGASRYAALESDARSIRQFEQALIPGILQTKGYVATLVRALGLSGADEEIERWLSMRMNRQQRLADVEFQLVVDESVLRRSFGDRAMLDEQLDFLVEVSQRENVAIRVLPFDAGPHPSLNGGFTVLAFPDPFPPVAHIETVTGEVWIEDEEKIEGLSKTFDVLWDRTLAPDPSRRFIASLRTG